MNLNDYDYLVIGAGLSGSVIARELAEDGKKIALLERRSHIGGNMYDYKEEHGFLVQKYGPHTFHTKKEELFNYMTKFGEWKKYKLKCGAVWDGKYSPTPFNFKTIDIHYPEKEAAYLKKQLEIEFPNQKLVTVVDLLSSSNSAIRDYALFLFKNDYEPYTSKQWGIPAEKVDISILKRVPVRLSYDEGYFDDPYEVMPKKSFLSFFENLLDHPNIDLFLNIEALSVLKVGEKTLMFGDEPLQPVTIYTGALDSLFNYCMGELPYRSLRFEWFYECIESRQEAAVVAYPKEKGYTRVTEYKKLPQQDLIGTVYAVEYPCAASYENNLEPYYPVLTSESRELYSKYEKRFKQLSNVYKCGRLADFRYYNMDQTLESALSLVKKLRNKG